MPVKRPRRFGDDELDPDLIELLLDGPSVDSFLEFDYRPGELSHIFERHEDQLLAEWRRRGRRGRPWAQPYGERRR